MKKYKRIFTIVIDSLGIGETYDSKDYDDSGADTLGHIAQSMNNFNIPNLQKLGLANLHNMKNVDAVKCPNAHYMRLHPKSCGKDTLSGHWEMMGINTSTPFKTFTETGFPKELIDALEERTGKKIVGNKSSSGTEILDELAHLEIDENKLIVYTSADSVMQICGNEQFMPIEKLYEYCEIARELTLKDEWKVGRIIARPYVGTKVGEFKRTSNRHDYALKPDKTFLNALKDNGNDVISVGKIADIFANEGITQTNKSKSSLHGMDQTIEIAKKDFNGLCFVNLVDFDALYGHRRDVLGYGKELELFDEKLGKLLPLITDEDLLLITADHGNDPSYKGTDHTRECVPLLIYSPDIKEGKNLGTADTFAVIGKTIVDNFSAKSPEHAIGHSLLSEI